MNFVPGHPTGKTVVKPIGEASREIGLPAGIARTDDHVVAIFEFGQKRGDMFGIVLTIGIHEYQHLPTGGACTTFNGRTIAHRVGGCKNTHPGLIGNCRGVIRGTIIDHDDFCICKRLPQCRQGAAQAFRLIFCWQDDAE